MRNRVLPSRLGPYFHFLLLPVFFSYAVVTVDEVLLFISKGQLTEDALRYLGDHVKIKPYHTFLEYLKELPSTLDLGDKSVGDFHSYTIMTLSRP